MLELYNTSMHSSNKNNNNNTHNNRKHAISKKKPTKSTHVPTACLNCKKAHLACDLSRPCKRCTSLGKCDTCIDIQHKKRGRPKLTANVKKVYNPNTVPKPKTQLAANKSTFVSLLPVTVPQFPVSSFNMTLNENRKLSFTAETLPQQQNEMMTVFLSMDLCCARVSDESTKILNMKPSELDRRSFYEFIHTESTDKLSRIHRLLLDNSHSTTTNCTTTNQPISFTTNASSELFLTSSPAQLFQIANGSQTLRETLKFKSTQKEFSCKFYLGGGFGADLFVPSTLDQLYMVCIVSEITSMPFIQQQQQQQQHQSKQLNSILDTSNLMSMYNQSLPTDDEAVRLVNQLCSVSPSTPPEYLSSSECSSIDTTFYLDQQHPSKSLEFDNLLLDDTLLLFSSQKNYWGGFTS